MLGGNLSQLLTSHKMNTPFDTVAVLIERDTLLADNATLRAAVDTITEENREMQDRLATLRQRVQELENAVTLAMHNECERLKAEVTQLRQDKVELVEALRFLVDELDQTISINYLVAPQEPYEVRRKHRLALVPKLRNARSLLSH